MKELQILDVIGNIADDLVLEAKEASVMKRRFSRSARMAMIAAAIIALMTMTALGVYAARHWDDVLTNVFHMGQTEQTMMDQSLTDVYASVERNGCIYTIKQVMGDEHCMVVSLDVKLPQDFAAQIVAIDELKALSDENGYDWEGVQNRLNSLYGYQEGDETVICGPHFWKEPILFPIELDENGVLDVMNEMIAEHPAFQGEGPQTVLSEENLELMQWALYRKALADYGADEQSGEGTGFGGGLFYEYYDPETNTYSVLIFMNTENDIQGRGCTLVLDNLAVEDVLGYYSQPYDPERYENNVVDNLLTEPLVMNFLADYTPIKRSYDILQDGAKIGTMELSPFSAYLSFPLEEDETVYSSLEAAANAENRKSYLEHSLHAFDITLTDGSVVIMQMQSAGIAYEETAFFMADRVIDLNQIESITLKGFTFEPLPSADSNQE